MQLGARLLIVSAYEPVSDQRLRNERVEVPEGPPVDRQPARGRARDARQGATGGAQLAGVAEVETFARQGDAADAILDVAEEQRSDLIVVGNRGMTGAKRFLLGSVPNRGLAPRTLLGADRAHDVSAVRRAARGIDRATPQPLARAAVGVHDVAAPASSRP